MQQEFGDEVTFIGVASRDEIPAIEDFVDKFNVGGFEQAIDTDGTVWEHYGVTSQPAFAFINDDGTVETRVGAMGVDSLSEQAQLLIDT